MRAEDAPISFNTMVRKDFNDNFIIINEKESIQGCVNVVKTYFEKPITQIIIINTKNKLVAEWIKINEKWINTFIDDEIEKWVKKFI